MESRGNRLGLFALILGAIALVIAFSGRHSAPNVTAAVPPAPPLPFNAAQVQADAEHAAAQARAEGNRAAAQARAEAQRAMEQARAEAQRWRGEGRWERGWDNPRRGHGGPFFVGPLFVVGNVVRVIAALLLIGFGIRLLRRGRGDRRGPGQGSGGPGTPIGPVFDA